MTEHINDTTTVERFRAGMKVYTSRAIDRMKDGKPGDEISREEMANVIGRSCDLGTNGYGNVNSAIRHVERVYGVCWRWSTAHQTWRCLNDSEKVDFTRQKLTCTARMNRRTLQTLATVNVDKLSTDERQEHTINCTVAALGNVSFGAPMRKRLKQENGVLQEPDLKRLVSALKPLEPRRDTTG